MHNKFGLITGRRTWESEALPLVCKYYLCSMCIVGIVMCGVYQYGYYPCFVCFVAILKCCVWYVQVWPLCMLFVYIAFILILLCVAMYNYVCSIYVQCICSYYDILCVVCKSMVIVCVLMCTQLLGCGVCGMGKCGYYVYSLLVCRYYDVFFSICTSMILCIHSYYDCAICVVMQNYGYNI